jgi:hypothetical protein
MDAFDRRTFLAGSAFTVTAALLPDRAQAAELMRARVRSLHDRWAEHREQVRATLFSDRPGSGDGPLHRTAEALAEGVAALSVMKDMELVAPEDQAHPGMQGLLKKTASSVAAACVACRELLDGYLAGDDPDRETHLRAAMRGIRLGLRDWDTTVGRQRQLELGLAELEHDSTPGSLTRHVRKAVARMRRIEELAAGIAERREHTGLLDVHDPRVVARVEAGKSRWAGETDDQPELPREHESGGSGKVVLGILLIGAGIVIGGFVVLLGICALACGSAALGVFVMLAGLGIMVLGIWHGVRLVQEGAGGDMAVAPEPLDRWGPKRVREEHAVAVVGAEGWVVAPVVRSGEVTLVVRGRGLVRCPGTWMADADGNGVAAGDDALVPGAPLGALVGRVGSDTFFLGSEGAVPEGADGPLELAINQPIRAEEALKGHMVARVTVLEPDRA